MVESSPTDADSAQTVAEGDRSSPAAPGKGIEKGQIVGNRFVVLEVIGEGGMGTVTRAYDPTLCREVALKQMRAGVLDELGEQRLLREAQSMARLSHPNVVAIHDAFVHRAQVTIAMEYVPGENLRAWTKSAQREWAEVVAAFRRAGEGLAAAHDAGLVHRDFKPANVLVTAEGEVKVGDFGLAKGVFDRPSESGHGTVGDDGSASQDELAPLLTDAETVLGTPRYMAPEQRRGRGVGPSADQFSFCVALWEALAGTPPFASADDERDQLPDWPRSSAVPRPIIAALSRGLAPDPAERWPSMRELLAALDLEPRRRRRRTLMLGGGGIAVAGVLAYGARIDTEPPACQSSGEQLQNVWNDVARRSVSEALIQVDTEVDVDAVIFGLDEYTTAWVQEHRDACEATMIRREQSPAMMDQRMYCLGAAKRDLSVTVDLLRTADDRTARKAKTLVRALPRAERCGDLEALATDVPPPEDAKLAEDVERWEEPLARARALNVAGHYAEARNAVAPVHEAAAELGWGPLQARAAEVHGDIVESMGDYERSVQLHEEAVRLALQHDVTRTAIQAASNLGYLLAYELDRPAEGSAWVTVAEGLVLGYEPGGKLDADVAQTRAAIAHAQGDFETASEELRRALKLLPASSGNAGSLRHNLAATLYAQGEYAQAAEAFRGVVEHFEGIYGMEHPAVADALAGLGATLREMGELEEAEGVLRRALAIREETLGESHDDTANNLHNLANVVSDRGNAEEALRLYARAVTIWEELRGPEHPRIATVIGAMATVKTQLGQTEEAEQLQRRALELIEASAGPEDAEVAYPLTNLGDLLRERGKLVEAQQALERAVRLREATLGENHPTLAATLDRLGRVHADAGRTDAARVVYTRAREIQRSADVSQAEQDETQARLDAL